MSLDFNDDLETSSENLDKNANVNSLLPLDDDRIIETDENGEKITQEETIEEIDPATIVTKHNFVTSPWTKLGIVGGFFALGFGVVFLAMNGLMNGRVNQITEVEEEAPPPAPFEEKNNGEVYAKLALQKQQNDLKNLNGEEETEAENNELVGEKSTAKNDSSKKETTPSKKAQPVKSQPPRTRTTARRATPPRQSPQPRNQTQRTIRRTPPPAIAKTPRPTPPPVKIPKVTIPPENSAQDKIAVDPLADIERLRNLSSFGRIDYDTQTSKSVVASTNIPQKSAIRDVSQETLNARRRRGYQDISQPKINRIEESDKTLYENNDTDIQQLKPKWTPTTIANTNNFYKPPEQTKLEPTAINKFNKFYGNQQLEPEFKSIPTKAERLRNALSKTQEIGFVNVQYLPEESRILEEKAIESEQYLIVGSTTKARLITTLVFAENNPNQNLRFVAQITEPIKSNTGEVAIPANTQVVITINNVDNSGSMNASVTSILKNGTEYPITPGSIDVLAKNGNPLVARNYNRGGNELLGNDITLSAISGLAKAGEVINEGDEIVEDLTNGGTRTRTSNNGRDIPAALIEGAFDSLSRDIRSRTQKKSQEIMSKPKIWRVKQGKEITLRVNRSIKL